MELYSGTSVKFFEQKHKTISFLANSHYFFVGIFLLTSIKNSYLMGNIVPQTTVGIVVRPNLGAILVYFVFN